MADTKYVYTFGDGKADGNTTQKALLGGKGANLAEMSRIGLPVPAGFTITTEVCTAFYKNDRTFPAELADQVNAAIKNVEDVMGKKYGDPENPLLHQALAALLGPLARSGDATRFAQAFEAAHAEQMQSWRLAALEAHVRRAGLQTVEAEAALERARQWAPWAEAEHEH